MKKVIISVTNDLVSDQRVHRSATTLEGMGCKVTLVGRMLPESSVIKNRSYCTHRFNLVFRKGPMFYFEYNFRLFFYLLFSPFDLAFANDMDTLPANYFACLLKRKPLIFDSHEYFSEVPELVQRPMIKKIWTMLENFFIPRVKHGITVSQPIADLYNKKYKQHFVTIRNLPFFKERVSSQINKSGIVIYQGAVNMGRGVELAIAAIAHVPDARLVVVGGGDVLHKCKQMVIEKGLQNKVIFTGRLPFEKLAQITAKAQLGISIEENLGLNYFYALPNKLFDYIQARVPVLVSNLPQMQELVSAYHIGEVTGTRDEHELAQIIEKMLSNQVDIDKWNSNLELAAKELNWECEQHKLKSIVEKIFPERHH